MKYISVLLLASFALSNKAMENKNNHLLLLARQNQRSEYRNIKAGGVLAAGIAVSKYIRYVNPDESSIATLLPLLPGFLMFGYNYFADYRERNQIIAQVRQEN